MDIRQLRYFSALKRCGSLAKAADELYITKQGLSKSITSMENELNCSLVLRSSSGVVLTEAGELVFEHAKKLLSIYDEMERSLAALDGGPQKIQIAFSYGFFYTMPMKCVLSFFEEHTKLEPEFLPRNDYSLERSVLNEDIDIGFCTNEEHWDELEYIPLFRNRRCILCAPDHPLAAQDEIDVTDLNGIQIVVPSPKYYFDMEFITRKCQEAGFKADCRAVDDNTMITQFPKSRKGVSLFVESLYSFEDVDDLKRVYFKDPSFTYGANVIFRKDRKLSQDASLLIQHLVEQCRILQENRRQGTVSL